MLSEKDLAQIINSLQTPIIIQDILDGKGELTNDIHLGLHEVLSEDQPDSCLLAIALSALKIANHYKNHYAAMGTMAIECERIIVEYGPIWLENANNKSLDNNQVFETLVHIPEDLDSLTELLEISAAVLGKHSEDIAAICNIMIVQAGAQALIAETFLDSMDMLESENDLSPWDLETTSEGIDTFIAGQALTSERANNVIQFPNIMN